MSPLPLVVLYDPDPAGSTGRAALLGGEGFRTAVIDDPGDARASIERDVPAAVVIVGGTASPDVEDQLRSAARGRGIPVLEVAPTPADAPPGGDRDARPGTLVDRLNQVIRGRGTVEAGMEVAMIAKQIPIDTHLLDMIVHDIRNPLNVISLTLRILEQLPPPIKSVIAEDLSFLDDNTAQITRLLTLISQYSRLIDKPPPIDPFPVEPARVLGELIEERPIRGLEKAYPIRLSIDESSPKSVHHDPTCLRLLLQCALSNAAGATDRPLLIQSASAGDRWRVSFRVDKAPPPTVEPRTIDASFYKRLVGTEAERVAFDVSLAAALARQLGGTVRLDVEPAASSTIVVDLPIGTV